MTPLVCIIQCLGYGHITPRSPEGQLATVIYAIIGIPLNFITIANIGSLMAKAFRFLFKNVFCRRCLHYHDHFTIASAVRRMNAQIKDTYSKVQSRLINFNEAQTTVRNSFFSLVSLLCINFK